MNMKQWVRRTWRVLDQRPAAEIDQGYTTSEIRIVLTAAMEALTDELKQDGNLTLRGFGKLYVETRSQRRVRNNLRDACLYHIPVRRGVRFRMAEQLIALLNNTATAQDSERFLGQK